MAIQALMARRDAALLRSELDGLRERQTHLNEREAELETALNEADGEEQLSAVRAEVEQFTNERGALESEIRDKSAALEAKETELRELEALSAQRAAPPPASAGGESPEIRAASGGKGGNFMNLRAFRGMSRAETAEFFARSDVNDFAERFRNFFRNAGSQSRAVSGAELLIPDVVLSILRENIANYSKLLPVVRVVSVAGTARQTIMGDVPEAVWTEACAALNELYFGMNQVETDGYKVGGYIAVCNALLEDTVPNLMDEIITALGRAIGRAIDKAILFGTGVKMPLGFVTRLAQSAAPANYPAAARPWEDLTQSNVITIPANVTGLALFQRLVISSGSAKGRYSNGEKFWVMTDATKMRLVSEAMSINAAGSIVTGIGDTMPIIGGRIITMGDGGEVIPDGAIYGGYGDEYLLVQRAGMNLQYSDIPLFLQDQTAFKATARYDGVPVIAEGFVAIGLDGNAPATSAVFPPDIANTPDATLRALEITGAALTPTFSANTTTYTATTTEPEGIVALIPATGAKAAVKINGKPVLPGRVITWKSGSNTVTIDVTAASRTDSASNTYTVTVTAS